MQIGAGLVKNTANIKDKAVRACSPPERSVIDCNLFPGGLTNKSNLLPKDHPSQLVPALRSLH